MKRFAGGNPFVESRINCQEFNPFVESRISCREDNPREIWVSESKILLRNNMINF